MASEWATGEIPKSKSQSPKKIPNPNRNKHPTWAIFGIFRCLEFFWDLGFGFWDLIKIWCLSFGIALAIIAAMNTRLRTALLLIFGIPACPIAAEHKPISCATVSSAGLEGDARSHEVHLRPQGDEKVVLNSDCESSAEPPVLRLTCACPNRQRRRNCHAQSRH